MISLEKKPKTIEMQMEISQNDKKIYIKVEKLICYVQLRQIIYSYLYKRNHNQMGNKFWEELEAK